MFLAGWAGVHRAGRTGYRPAGLSSGRALPVLATCVPRAGRRTAYAEIPPGQWQSGWPVQVPNP